MTTADPVIDMMALADIGHPRRLAHEIHRQLREQYGAVPLRVPLEGIARAVGIVGIKDCEGVSFEGTLVIQNGAGAIGLLKGMPKGRRNFTLGHEIGHYLIPSHRLGKTRFECAKKVFRYERGERSAWDSRPAAERIEVEANEFSATLVVPIPEYRTERAKHGRPCDVSHLRALAQAFSVSQEVIARVYVDHGSESAAIVISQNGIVRRVIPKKDFPFLGLRSGAEIPRHSLTRQFRASNDEGEASSLEEVDVHTWIDRQGNVTSLCEQVLLQRDGWATTLLTVEEDEEDDEADDSNWNRRNQPRRAFG